MTREYGMTPQQQNIYDMVRRYPGSCLGNIGGVIRFPLAQAGKGCVDGPAEEGGMADADGQARYAGNTARNAEEEMCARRIYETACRVQELNPALRLRVSRQGRLYLSEECAVFFDVVDGRGETEEKVRRRIGEWSDIPVFAYDACLVRYLVIETEEYLYLAGIYHHLICDGIGLMKVTRELWELGMRSDSPLWRDVLPDGRFLAYLEEMEARTAKPVPEAYKSLCAQEHFVFPDRRESTSERAEVFQKKVEREVCGQISAWCDGNGLTAEHVFEAALAIHDSRITGAEWASLGRVMINRKKKYMDTAGMFTNVLPLVVQVSEEKTFPELCGEIKRQEYLMLKCGDYTVRELRSENRLTGRLYDTCVTYRPLKRLPLQHADFMWETECSAVEVPLRFLIDEQADGICLTYKYMSDRYSRREIEELDRSLFEVIREGLQEDGNHRPAGSTMSCDAQAPDGGCFGSNADKAGLEVEDVAAAFDRNVREHGNQAYIIDVTDHGRTVSYREAGMLVDRIADRLVLLREQHLKRDGGGQGMEKQPQPLMAGLRLSRTMLMPLVMMACLKTGTIFVPVALGETCERLTALSEQLDVILTDDWAASALGGNTVASRGKPGSQNACGAYAPVSAYGRQVAYGIHTSGSTGKPKLVRLYRDALNLRLAWMKEHFGLSGCRILQKTRNTFDVSVWELLLSAACGGSLVMLPDGWEREPEKIRQVAKRYQVDTLHFVPSMLSVYLSWAEQSGKKEKTAVKRVFSSGEALTPAMVDRFYTLFPFTKLYNLYGPAECTIDVSWHACSRGERVVPVGKPVWGTGLHVVNPKGRELPQGYIGEILVTGTLVGEGYVNNPEETAARFVEWNGRRAYHTGDLGYYSDAGELVYAGRIDREVKLRGMRVSLSVLEQETSMISGIGGAAALVSDNRLILFAETAMSSAEVRTQLAKRVAPHYMPDVIQCLAQLPYNRNGKCDYALLSTQHMGTSGCETGMNRCKNGMNGCERGINGRKAGTNRYKNGVNGCKSGINGRKTGTNRRKNGVNGCKSGISGCKAGTNRRKNGMNGCEGGINGHKTGMNRNGVEGDRLEQILWGTARKVLGRMAPAGPDQSLRECGLDSISIVEWMLALEKQGVKADYEDIAGAETVRELAGILAGKREGVRPEREKPRVRTAQRKLLCRLTDPVPRSRRRGFVLAVPYAGMGIHCFSLLADAFWDRGYELLACDVSGRRDSVSCMSGRIFAELEALPEKEDEIVVIGCCVGSALAISLVERLNRKWEGRVRLALIGSLPVSFLGAADRRKLLWDLIPGPAANLCLSALQGRRLRLTEEMRCRLRTDARKYVQWMTDHPKPPVKVETHLFFGDRDVLTAGFQRKYALWNRYLAGPVSVTGLGGAYHFCLHSHAGEIAEQVAADRIITY